MITEIKYKEAYIAPETNEYITNDVWKDIHDEKLIKAISLLIENYNEAI